MGFFDSSENVEEYIRMTEGYDFSFVFEKLLVNLIEGSSLLEIGMGPGKDLLSLDEKYKVTGSDASAVFVERFKKLHATKAIEVMQLDAVTLTIEKTFDCIYSNKVLMHLEKAYMKQSLLKQQELLNPGGIIFCTLWYGNSREEYGELLFNYYTEESINEVIPSSLEIKTFERYTEEEKEDSFVLILQRKE